jgi:hypothetical protein
VAAEVGVEAAAGTESDPLNVRNTAKETIAIVHNATKITTTLFGMRAVVLFIEFLPIA